MSEPFLGQVMMVGFNFAPRSWATCDGQLLPINQNQSLYSLLGTNFGGDGRTTFALPDLRGRTPVHIGGGVTLGQRAGAETHTLNEAEIPEHTHAVKASNARASTDHAEGAFPAAGDEPLYTTGAPTTSFSSSSVTVAPGGGQAHENMQPFLAVYFVIALAGVFPSRD